MSYKIQVVVQETLILYETRHMNLGWGGYRGLKGIPMWVGTSLERVEDCSHKVILLFLCQPQDHGIGKDPFSPNRCDRPWDHFVV